MLVNQQHTGDCVYGESEYLKLRFNLQKNQTLQSTRLSVASSTPLDSTKELLSALCYSIFYTKQGGGIAVIEQCHVFVDEIICIPSLIRIIMSRNMLRKFLCLRWKAFGCSIIILIIFEEKHRHKILNYKNLKIKTFDVKNYESFPVTLAKPCGWLLETDLLSSCLL